MAQSVYVYDSTIKDTVSKIRGVGRYLQLLRENFPKWKYIGSDEFGSIPFDSVFINPFLNLVQPPLTLRRVAKYQIGIIYDLIPLKYPTHFPIGLKGNLNVFLNKLILKNYDLIITDSEYAKKDIVTMLNIPEEKVKVIYPTLPKIFKQTSDVRPKMLENTKKNLISTVSDLRSNYCLYVGDATWNKNLVNLAKAIKLANISCVFVGKVFEKENIEQLKMLKEVVNPWQQELMDFVKEIDDDPRFILAGYIHDNELMKLYKQSYLNILLSRDEGFGFSFLEAATIGCPSILSQISTFKETAKDCALFVQPDKPKAIAEKIKEIFGDDKLRMSIISKALERSKFFSSLRFVISWEELLK
ncbi:MAG: glycosyltransferase family 1 protein [bacterium]|nr:glycosyltransferase family 1 protein [bacterium]